MKKPTKAIERVREFYIKGDFWDDSVRDLLAYLDAIPDDAVFVRWPEGLTRERLMDLARNILFGGRLGAVMASSALGELAAIAPEAPKKRMVNLWVYGGDTALMRPTYWRPPDGMDYRKVNAEPVEISDE